jgi:hypothetical protein
VGQTCTWKAAGTYKNDFSITLNDFGTATTGSCTTLPAENKASDDAAITAYASSSFSAFDSTSTVTCAKASSNDASVALPSLAVMGLFMLTRV